MKTVSCAMANSPLQQLRDTLGRPAAAVFVEEQIGPLLAFDRDGCQLRCELDRALGAFGVAPEVGQHQLGSPAAARAITLLGLDLDDADERLAVHLLSSSTGFSRANPATVGWAPRRGARVLLR